MDNHTQELASESRAVAVLQRLFCGAVVAVSLGGCVVANLGRTDQEIVAQKAQERWDLLVKSDFRGAYGYISPAGRELVTADAYAAGLKRDFWTGAKVGQIECAAADACEVEVLVEYQHRGLRMKTGMREKWVRQRSNWWFVLQR